MSGLRVFPNLDVMRPADPEETAAAYAAALDRKDGPTALILTRQNVRTLKEIPVSTCNSSQITAGDVGANREGCCERRMGSFACIFSQQML